MSETKAYIDMVEDAWKVSYQVRDYVQAEKREVSNEEIFEKIFSTCPDLDLDKTQKEGGKPLVKIFFKNPYGLQYRPAQKDWIPFRHGELKL
jgi:hypothetical protein